MRLTRSMIEAFRVKHGRKLPLLITSIHERICRAMSYAVSPRLGCLRRGVVTLLGKPDSVSDRRAPGGAPLPGIHIYESKLARGRCISVIYLDTNDRVVRSEIYGY
jgi:hypothetical protein